MKILITGASGFIGKELSKFLILDKGYEIRALTRNKDRFQASCELPIKAFEWEPSTISADPEAFKDIDIIINLAGESVAGSRWSSERKKRILDSRVNSIKTILKYKDDSSLKKIISSSAIGIYGSRADEVLTTKSNLGDDFLAKVCKEWETPILSLKNVQTTCVRTGIVLGMGGGALEQMLPPFKAGFGGKLGEGSQYMSWIHIKDIVCIYSYLIENDIQGVVNGVAPNPVNNKAFTKTLGQVLNKPTFMSVPSIALKALLGEMSQIVLNSQRVHPNILMDRGFKFQYSSLSGALEDVLQYEKKNEKVIDSYQYIKKTREDIFDFFSNEKNLEQITPSFLNFRVLGKSTTKIQAGTIIDYKLKIKGFPVKWKTEIEQFEENNFFIDNQLSGPYKKWHHSHYFYDYNGHSIIRDFVIYKVPGETIGNLLLGWLIKRDITKIFNYRRKVINEKFN